MGLLDATIFIVLGFCVGYGIRDNISRSRRMRWKAERRLGTRVYPAATA
ncbi:hypothetical protein IY145_18095 [Methylosinus sp. H3A]|nr:hypothetical protein [Methylosinus sp. H3A]MBG0811266.1 hypothetical protein [Methylosinus sp. H3A]